MQTIKSRREFGQVFTHGERYGRRLVRITVMRDAEGGPGKVAFVAPKKLGNAVHRNRCKRVLREAARQVGLPRDGARVILFATRRTGEAHPADIASELEVLLTKAGV
jgi:ribonuclease P protein component